MWLRNELNKRRINYHKIKISQIGLSDDKRLLTNIPILPKLDKRELEKICQIWGTILDRKTIKRGLIYYRILKSLRSFDELYLPSAYYVPYICFLLNKRTYIPNFVHKSFADIHFKEALRPNTVVKSIGGCFYGEDYKPMTKYEVVKLLSDSPDKMILKKATETSGGKGIVFIEQKSKAEIETLLNKYEGDIIIQNILDQSPQTAIFNPECLNTFRVTTLNLNGQTTVLSRCFKMGALSSKVDNIGAGGVIVGIKPDGHFDNKGFLINGQVVTEFNGIIFNDLIIDDYRRIDDLAIKLHSRIEHIHIIGWDIALDSENKPVIIEANATWPGITMEQLCTGPIFGNRTWEVIDFCKDNYNNPVV